MTEEEARAAIVARHGEAAAATIACLLAMVADENGRQNLIAPSTLATIWERHALDSAQLLAFDRPDDTWLDIGTGGGFPGMVVAILRRGRVTMVEPRARRAAFLRHAVMTLGLANAVVVAGRIERWSEPAGVISARAVASLDAVFASARHCAGPATRWVLPKGRTAGDDLDAARRHWHGLFHVEQSIVDPDAGIVVAERVERR